MMSLVYLVFKARHLVNNLLKMDSTNQFYQLTTADAEFGYQNEIILYQAGCYPQLAVPNCNKLPSRFGEPFTHVDFSVHFY